MAEPFADIMAAFLAQPVITTYSKLIERQHVMEVIKEAKVSPFLRLWATDNTVDDDACDVWTSKSKQRWKRWAWRVIELV